MRIAIPFLFAAFVALTGCVRTLNQAPVHIAAPVESIEGAPNLSRDGRFYFSGQPDEASLRELSSRGVVKVINLRTEAEMEERVDFDEAALLQELDVVYVHLPLPRENRDEWLEEFTKELGQTRGPVLIHCGSSSRVGGVWGRYLRLERGFNRDDALLRARAAGLNSEGLADWVASPAPVEAYR